MPEVIILKQGYVSLPSGFKALKTREIKESSSGLSLKWRSALFNLLSLRPVACYSGPTVLHLSNTGIPGCNPARVRPVGPYDPVLLFCIVLRR
jgi:hypothetical protein